MSSLPDTFAGGRFDLPLKVAKLVRKAQSPATTEHEWWAIHDKLEQWGYYLDKVCILWDLDTAPSDFVRFTEEARI